MHDVTWNENMWYLLVFAVMVLIYQLHRRRSLSGWTLSAPGTVNVSWFLNKWLLSFIAIAVIGSLLYWFGLFSLLLSIEWAELFKEGEKAKWTKPWVSIAGAAGAAMLTIALVVVILAVFGRVGWRRASALILSLTLGTLVVVYLTTILALIAGHDGLLSWRDTFTSEGLLSTAIIAAGILLIVHWLLKRNHSDSLVLAIRAVCLAILLFIVVPPLARWVTNNTAVCASTDEDVCREARAKRIAYEEERALAIQAGVEKAKSDAKRQVSLACTGPKAPLTLRPGEVEEINLPGCTMPVDVVEGGIVFISHWWKRSKTFHPGECIKLDFNPTTVEAAPGFRVSKLRYSHCAGSGLVDFDCLPIQKIAVCS